MKKYKVLVASSGRKIARHVAFLNVFAIAVSQEKKKERKIKITTTTTHAVPKSFYILYIETKIRIYIIQII